MLTIEVHERATIDISHSGSTEYLVDIASTERNRGIATNLTLVATAIDATANDDLGLDMQGRQHKEQHEQPSPAVRK
jgi:hypothetical protein